jgi:hypothetical protein
MQFCAALLFLFYQLYYILVHTVSVNDYLFNHFPQQVAAWDANLVTPHKRMGNAGLCLESLCDGNYFY